MNLHITLTDVQLIQLNEELKITGEDSYSIQTATECHPYAKQILRARRILDMDMGQHIKAGTEKE